MHEDPPRGRPRLPSPLQAADQKAPGSGGASGPAGDSMARAQERFPAEERRPAGTRFNIKFLMLLTLVVAIATAGYNGMRLGGERRIAALMFTLVAPIVLLVVLSAAQRLVRRKR